MSVTVITAYLSFFDWDWLRSSYQALFGQLARQLKKNGLGNSGIIDSNALENKNINRFEL